MQINAMEQDFYKTVSGAAVGLYKEKGSKFIAKVFHAETEEEIKMLISSVKKEYHDARHHCFAYRINPEKEQFRSSDDGEPSGTAGKPILNQLLSFELFNVLVVVVRYFGGTKLGVSGLINAYKSATRDALNHSTIVTRFITRELNLSFPYPLMNNVMRIVKEEKLEITAQLFELSCVLRIKVKKNDLKRVGFRLGKIRGLRVKELENS
ncbi:MAG: YigZ family protein [Bacteroidales bacterium]|nr:YigZ family protein [Bacteroidales bacterium]